MKILVVDDHALIREAIGGVLRDLVAEAHIVEAANSREAMAQVAEHPDLALILLDLNLPDRNGFAVMAEIRASYPAVSVVILSGNNDRESVMKALDLGALGFIPKSDQREVMLNALRLIVAGGIYIPSEILARRETGLPAAAPSGTTEQRANPISPASFGLTARQLEVLALMMRGKSNKAICRSLDLAEPTVKNHVTAILKSLNVTNRTEAVVMVGELGWELPPVNG